MGCVVAAAIFAAMAAAGPALAAPGVVDERVAFAVTNGNQTGVPCSTDGASYTIEGEIVGPASLLSGQGAQVAEVYLHDLGVSGAFEGGVEGGFWHFQAVPGYDYATQMAGQGFVSVLINELGYAPSSRPPGNSSCIGGQATILHQVITALKTGRYTVLGGNAGIAFRRVITLGESIGAEIAQVEAYTFNDIAALGVIGYADNGSSQQADQQSLISGQVCATGGQPADGSSGAGGYAYFEQTDSDFRSAFFNQANADPGVVAAATTLHVRAPCGDLSSIIPAIFLDNAMDGQIATPVLLVYGDHDSSYPSSGAQQQAGMYSASKDVTTDIIRNAGHAFTLERTAGTFEADMTDWLVRLSAASPPPPSPIPQPGPSPSPSPNPGPSPSPPPSLRGSLLQIRSRTARINRRARTAPVSVRCNASQTCRGNLALYWQPPSTHRSPRPPLRLLGLAQFRILGGRTARLEVRIRAGAYRAVGTRPSTAILAVAHATIGTTTTTVRATVKLTTAVT